MTRTRVLLLHKRELALERIPVFRLVGPIVHYYTPQKVRWENFLLHCTAKETRQGPFGKGDTSIPIVLLRSHHFLYYYMVWTTFRHISGLWFEPATAELALSLSLYYFSQELMKIRGRVSISF